MGGKVSVYRGWSDFKVEYPSLDDGVAWRLGAHF